MGKDSRPTACQFCLYVHWRCQKKCMREVLSAGPLAAQKKLWKNWSPPGVSEFMKLFLHCHKSLCHFIGQSWFVFLTNDKGTPYVLSGCLGCAVWRGKQELVSILWCFSVGLHVHILHGASFSLPVVGKAGLRALALCEYVGARASTCRAIDTSWKKWEGQSYGQERITDKCYVIASYI